jgi:hypothetical protein
LFFKGTCTFKCRSQIKEGDHLALNFVLYVQYIDDNAHE